MSRSNVEETLREFVEEVLNDYDYEDKVADAVNDAVSDYDFSDNVDKVLESYDWNEKFQDYTESEAFRERVQEIVADYLKNLFDKFLNPPVAVPVETKLQVEVEN